MIKITLKHNEEEKKLIVPEQKTVLEILKEAGKEPSPFGDEKVLIGNRVLDETELNKDLIDLGFLDSSELTIRIVDDLPWETDDAEQESDEAADPPKANVIGCACVIFSAFTPEELKDFRRYIPEALTLRNKAGEPVFAIALDENSPGSLNENGAVFSKQTNAEGKATITIILDPSCDDPEELVRKRLGSSIVRLTALEKRLTKKLPCISHAKSELGQQIRKI